jgi:hypothetical protein
VSTDYDGFVFLSDDVPTPPTDDTLRAAWTLALSEADYETIKHALVIAGNTIEVAKGSDASERFDVLYDQLDEWNHSDKP